jgi:hypothetical protein
LHKQIFLIKSFFPPPGGTIQAPGADSAETLTAKLNTLRWHEDPAVVLGKENTNEVYLARLVATTIWRNRSMATEQKKYVVQGVINQLQTIIAERNKPAKTPAPAKAAKAAPAPIAAQKEKPKQKGKQQSGVAPKTVKK